MSNSASDNHVFTLQKKGNKTVRLTFTQTALTLEDNYNKRWEIVGLVVNPIVCGLFILYGILEGNIVIRFFGLLFSINIPFLFYRAFRFVDARDLLFDDIDRISVRLFFGRWLIPIRIHLKNGKVRPIFNPINSIDLARFKQSALQFGVVVDKR